MVMLSVATSIDALAVGLGLAVLNVSIWLPAVVIGLVAGGFTILGLIIGKSVVRVSGVSRFAEMAGGLLLLAIGFHVLADHGVFRRIFASSP